MAVGARGDDGDGCGAGAGYAGRGGGASQPLLRPRTISLLLLLPIALPGIVTGIALRSTMGMLEIPFSFWTIVIGHATFCVVTVYNNVLAPSGARAGRRWRPPWTWAPTASRPSAISCCPTWARQCWLVESWPLRSPFDEIIVTTFTAGQQQTLPIWIFSQLFLSPDRPVTNNRGHLRGAGDGAADPLGAPHHWRADDTMGEHLKHQASNVKRQT